MKVWKKSKGNRIRASDKSLVYHFCIGWLLLLSVAVFLLLNLQQLLVTDWKDFNLLHVGITWTAYNSITVLIATGVCALVAFLYYRYGYDRIKRLLHRQKKQELQKAQEARQTVHANGSATAGATRSHERPVATPVSKTAQTDTVIKPDMKRPATSPVIKNAEVKAGKETVRTNIRQEQQVKGVTRTNQPNVVESRSNQKKTTIQKQVNQKQNRKTVTKQPEKGRKK